MAKRESQGLQIALILLVMLSVLFAITTIVFWNIGKNAKAELVQKRTEATDATSRMRSTIDENISLKNMLGHTAEVAMPEIEKTFGTDMQKFGSSFPKEEQNYRKLPDHLGNTNLQLHDKVATAIERIQELEKTNEQLNKEKETQIAAARKDKESAKQEYLKERSNFDTELQKLASQRDSMNSKWDGTRKGLVAKGNALEKQVNGLTDEVASMQNQNDKLSSELSQLRTESFERPDGKITWVDNRGETVYVNLGSEDALQRQTSFSVYDLDENNLARTEKKASIEITRILGNHLAEATVVNDDNRNPIVSGDIIFSPVWEVGSPVRFALTGFMDIDNDAASDRALIRRLIRMNGGVIDAEVDDKGDRTGELSVETRYLVTGDSTDEKSSAKRAASDSKIRSEAKSLGLTVISINRLLSDLGYQKISKTIALGRESSGSDYSPSDYGPRFDPAISR
jgi:hypothetical protein